MVRRAGEVDGGQVARTYCGFGKADRCRGGWDPTGGSAHSFPQIPHPTRVYFWASLVRAKRVIDCVGGCVGGCRGWRALTEIETPHHTCVYFCASSWVHSILEVGLDIGKISGRWLNWPISLQRATIHVTQ
jgi:hypothetical protein